MVALILILVMATLADAIPAAGQPVSQRETMQALEGRDLNLWAASSFRSRDFEMAEVWARKAWTRFEEEGNARDAGLAAANLAAVLTVRGRLGEALDWQDEAEELFQQARDERLLGRLLVARAVTNFLRAQRYSNGEGDEALRNLRLARRLLGLTDFRLECMAASILCRSNEPNRAQSGYMALRRYLAACESSGDHAGAAICAMRLGQVEGTTGGHGAALGFYTLARNLFQGAKDTAGVALALRNAGLARWKLERYKAAEASFVEALELSRQTGDRALEVTVLNDLSMFFMEIDRAERASRCDREAQEALSAIATGIQEGRVSDTVTLDFFDLMKIRYANKLPYRADLFRGFYDQLVLEPGR